MYFVKILTIMLLFWILRKVIKTVFFVALLIAVGLYLVLRVQDPSTADSIDKLPSQITTALQGALKWDFYF